MFEIVLFGKLLNSAASPGAKRPMSPEKITEVRYIKLGEGGEWEKECIERKSTIKLGYDGVSHKNCRNRRWGAVEQKLATWYTGPGEAHSHRIQIEAFYESPGSVLWITFYEGRMWWCFSPRRITLLPDKRKTRPAREGWSDSSLTGVQLVFDVLAPRIVNKRFYQMTTFALKNDDAEYVINVIFGSGLSDGLFGPRLCDTAALTAADGYFDPDSLGDERERVLGEIVRRRGRARFRDSLIRAYGGKCAVTGCDAEAALEAAHIARYSGHNSDVIVNGLLLRADIHTLFDLYLIGIDPATLTVSINQSLQRSAYAEYEGKKLTLPASSAHYPSKKALTERWRAFTDAQ